MDTTIMLISILGGLKLFFTIVLPLLGAFGSMKGNGTGLENMQMDMNTAGMSDLDRFMADVQQQEFMDFSMKSVTPFEMGGFDMNQGNSFNMDFGTNDFGGFGGCGMF